MRIHIFLVLLFLFGLGCVVHSQTRQIGNPYITNYAKNDIEAGAQNFSAIQDSRGRMYFGNGMGVVVFDGNHWRLVPVTNNSYVRSLAIDKNNRVYVGAYQEFGYLEVDSSGYLQYKSLVSLIEGEIPDFADIWSITAIDDKVFFQSYYAIFEYSFGEINTIRPKNEFIFSFDVGGQLFVEERGLGLFQFLDGDLKMVADGEFFSTNEIRSIIPLPDDKLLICSRGNGLFLYRTGEITNWNKLLSERMKRHKISCGVMLDETRLAFGTVQNGVFITDYSGDIVMTIGSDQGLLDDAIENLYADQNKNLWVMHNRGVDYIQTSSPFSILATGIGSGYASCMHGDNIYFGTNRGLYTAPWRQLGQVNQSTFNLVPNTVGQVWTLSEHRGFLLLGHHEGAFIINGQQANRISDIQGYWQFIDIPSDSGFLLAGTYTGYSLFEIDGAEIRFVRKIEGFSESCRISYFDDRGDLWMSHGWKGIYRLRLNEAMDGFSEIQYFNNTNHLPSNSNNDIFKFNSQVYVTTVDGVFRYNPSSKALEKNHRWSSFFDFSQPLSKVLVSPDKSILNFGGSRVGRLTILNDTLFLNDYLSLSFLRDKTIPPFESATWYNQKNMIIGTQNGFVHYQPDHDVDLDLNRSTEIVLFEAIGGESSISIGGDLFREGEGSQEIVIPYRKNFVRVHVAGNFFSNSENSQYRYQLSGLSEEWSNWSTNAVLEFPRLKEGDYQLTVKSRNFKQEEGAEAKFMFRVLPPWYRTWIAYLGFGLLLFVIVGLTVYLINRRLNHLKQLMVQKQKRLIEEKQRKIKEEKQKAEQELIRLRNDKLRNEVIHKSKELANTAHGIIHKNKVLNEIKADLKLMAEESKNLFVQRKIKGLLRKIDKDIATDRGHEVFRANFDKVHENFINKIRKAHPELTPKDLQLCSYLRMNMTTKEIAPMLNISVRGVEISRYRLRKKLNLQHDENLTDYILNFN